MQFHLTTYCCPLPDYLEWVLWLEFAIFAFVFFYLLSQCFKVLLLKRRIRWDGQKSDRLSRGSRNYRLDGWKMGLPLVVLSWISVFIAIGMVIHTTVTKFPKLDSLGIYIRYSYREGFILFWVLYCGLAMLTAVSGLSAWFVRKKMSDTFDRFIKVAKEREV